MTDWYQPPAEAPASSPTAGDGSPPLTTSEVLLRVTPAHAGVRALARLLDLGAVALLATVGAAAAGVLCTFLENAGKLSPGWDERWEEDSVAGTVLGLLAMVAYHAVAEGLGGASLGKILLRTRVRRVTLAPCTVPRAALREALVLVDLLFFGMVAYSVMQRSPLLQRLGDKAAKTLVLQAKSVEGLPAPPMHPWLATALGASAAAALYAVGYLVDAF